MLKDEKFYANLPLCWKKGFDSSDIMPEKVRSCRECKTNSIIDGCDKKNRIKEFAPNPNELKRQPMGSFAHMLPWCNEKLDEYLQRLSI